MAEYIRELGSGKRLGRTQRCVLPAGLYNASTQWRFPAAPNSARTKSFRRSEPAEWAKCIARAIRNWGARLR